VNSRSPHSRATAEAAASNGRYLREQDSLVFAPQLAECIGSAGIRISLQRRYDTLEQVFVKCRESTP